MAGCSNAFVKDRGKFKMAIMTEESLKCLQYRDCEVL